MALNLAPGILPDGGQRRSRPEELQPLVVDKEYFHGKVKVTASLAREPEPEPELSLDLEPETEPEPKPVPKPKKETKLVTAKADWKLYPGHIFRFILAFALLFLTTTICTHMIYRGMSAREAVIMTFAGNQQQLHQHQPSAPSFYPLWTKHHDTQSSPLSLSELYAKPLVSSLEASFRAHMHNADAQYACLCMHHIVFPTASGLSQKRVCGVYNRRAPVAEMYVMVNPQIIGASNTTDAFNEASVSCVKQKPTPTRRHKQVVLEWTDPETRDLMYSRFSGMSAVCMQLAIDEMNGNKHCVYMKRIVINQHLEKRMRKT